MKTLPQTYSRDFTPAGRLVTPPGDVLPSGTTTPPDPNPAWEDVDGRALEGDWASEVNATFFLPQPLWWVPLLKINLKDTTGTSTPAAGRTPVGQLGAVPST